MLTAAPWMHLVPWRVVLFWGLAESLGGDAWMAEAGGVGEDCRPLPPHVGLTFPVP